MNRYLMFALPATCVVASAAMASMMSPKQYIMTAGASDLFERQSSQLVANSTGNAKLKALAREMVVDHTKSTTMVKAAAAQAKIKVSPPILTPAQQDMLTQLRAANGADRDSLYITQQRSAHAEALTVQQGYAMSGTVPSLRGAAAKIVPVVKHHIAMLDAM